MKINILKLNDFSRIKSLNIITIFLLLYSIDMFYYKRLFFTYFYIIFLLEFFEGSYFLPYNELKNQILNKYSTMLEPSISRIKELKENFYLTIFLTNITFFLFILIIIMFSIHLTIWHYLYLIPKSMEFISKILLFNKVNKYLKNGFSYYESLEKVADEKNLDVFYPQSNIVEYLYIPFFNSAYLFFLYLISFQIINI